MKRKLDLQEPTMKDRMRFAAQWQDCCTLLEKDKYLVLRHPMKPTRLVQVCETFATSTSRPMYDIVDAQLDYHSAKAFDQGRKLLPCPRGPYPSPLTVLANHQHVLVRNPFRTQTHFLIPRVPGQYWRFPGWIDRHELSYLDMISTRIYRLMMETMKGLSIMDLLVMISYLDKENGEFSLR